jgi:hypothetical protein
MYPNRGGAPSSSGRQQIGTGWADFVHAAGNADSTPHADLFGIRNSTGELFYYPDGGGKTKIGNSGWTNYRIFPADFNGDDRADIVAIDTSGDLWFYANTSQNGVTLASRTQSGNGGWGAVKVAAMDLSGDGDTDLVAIDSDGIMWLYRGEGDGRFASRTQLGLSHWNVNDIG